MFFIAIFALIGYPLVVIPLFAMLSFSALFAAVAPPPPETPYVVPLGDTYPSPADAEELRHCIWRYINGNPNKYIHISKWNIAHITDMSYLCQNIINSKQRNDALAGIEEWDMSNVRITEAMFNGCNKFNQPIGKWNLCNVRSISEMFLRCWEFNQTLEEWETTLGKHAPYVKCEDVFTSAYTRDCELPKWLQIQRKRQQYYNNTHKIRTLRERCGLR